MTQERRTALYARVSTGNQGSGLEAQVRALRNYCSQRGIQNFLLFQDENQSGVKASRPALDKMMIAARQGEVDKVIVYSFSRYARSTTHLLNALQEFKKLGIEFISISENIETNSPLGTAIFAILGAVAQLERDILIERVKVGLENARAKGIKIGRKKSRDSALIRRLYLSGVTYREMSRIAKCSTGAIAAEVRELKKEIKSKDDLDRILKDREFESVQVELGKTRARVALLESKIPTNKLDDKKKPENPDEVQPSESTNGDPVEVVI